MRLILQHANVRTTDDLDTMIEQSVRDLRPLVRIEEARIRVEYDHDASPAYRASAHLVIPGPDLRVETIDHTPRTAVAKLLAELRARAAAVALRRQRRHTGQRPVRRYVRLARA